MSMKEELEIFDKFKDLEQKLTEVLKTIPKEISEEGKGSDKENIKSYSDKVKKARELFDQYEALAEKLNKMNNENENDEESIEVSKKVVDSRVISSFKVNDKDVLDQYRAMSRATKGLEKVEIEALGDQVVVKKKKKNETQSSKEL